jgi:GMP synthase-like glutamine amidotransferase
MVLVESKSTSSCSTESGTHVAPTILRRTIWTADNGSHNGDNNNNNIDEEVEESDDRQHPGDGEELVLIVLGCEASPPYGPYLHTAGLFLDLLEASVRTLVTKADRKRGPPEKMLGFSSIALHVYPVSRGVFPTSRELHQSRGVILPGSFNSAYDDEEWIHKLKDLIQTELVPKGVPALGVCFGHQVYAHSFGGEAAGGDQHSAGSAVRCPAGRQAGRRSSLLTNAGLKYLRQSSSLGSEGDDDDSATQPTTSGSDDSEATKLQDTLAQLDLFYTHGDMVEKLPPHGVSLGGDNKVPIQAAIYFAPSMDGPPETQEVTDDSSARVIAVTFQAHPEYASSRERGLDGTLKCVIREMAKRGDITAEEAGRAEEDAALHYERVREDSIDAMIAACQLLGWFPKAVVED